VNDQVALFVPSPVPLPAGVTHRLTLWIDGVAIASKLLDGSNKPCEPQERPALAAAVPTLAGFRLGRMG
jgi:hypothetical protein